MFIKQNEGSLARRFEKGHKDVDSWWNHGACSQPGGNMGNCPESMDGSEKIATKKDGMEAKH